MKKLTIKHLAPYLIYSNGCIRHHKTLKEVKQFTDKYGYKRVNLHLEGKTTQCLVHRLVAIRFIDNPKNKPQVNHIDGDKTNNWFSNLEWATNQENRDHAVQLGLHFHHTYSVQKDGVYCGEFKSTYDISKEFMLDQSAISKVVNGHYKTTKGYKITRL